MKIIITTKLLYVSLTILLVYLASISTVGFLILNIPIINLITAAIVTILGLILYIILFIFIVGSKKETTLILGSNKKTKR